MNPDFPQHPPATGWQSITILLEMVIANWGAPAALAAKRAITRAQRKIILIWLIPLEALARRLLMIMAAEEPRPQIIERKARSRTQPVHGRANLWSDDSRAWGVSFALIPPRIPKDQKSVHG